MNDQLIRRLIEKWRASDPYACVGVAKKCADELEAALAPLSGPVDASGEPRTWMSMPVEQQIAAVLSELTDAAVPSSPAQEQEDELREAINHYQREIARLKTIGLNQYGEPALP